MTRKQKILFIGSVALNVAFVGWALMAANFEIRGGQGERSPDGKWRAKAWSSSKDFQFSICPHDDSMFERPAIRNVVVTPTDNRDPLYFRELPGIVAWAPDSSRVSFTIPTIAKLLNVEMPAMDGRVRYEILNQK